MTEIDYPFIVNGPDGPVFIVTCDPLTMNPWVAIRSHNPNNGAGGFLTFQATDSAGRLYDAFSINGGFIKNKAGAVSSCCDFNSYSAGKPFTVSIVGEADGFPANIGFDPREVPVNIGSTFNGATDAYLKVYPLPSKYIGHLPGNPTTCIHVDGKILPLLDP